MINYKIQEIIPTEKEKCCATCKHMFAPIDFLILGSNPEIFCNLNKDRTISGDVLTEPFDYYNSDNFTAQEKAWAEWSSKNKVDLSGICDSYEGVT
jgi:hypothetical protein